MKKDWEKKMEEELMEAYGDVHEGVEPTDVTKLFEEALHPDLLHDKDQKKDNPDQEKKDWEGHGKSQA